MNHVAGIVVCNFQRSLGACRLPIVMGKRLKVLLKVAVEAVFRQEFMHIEDGNLEACCCVEEFAVGLHGVATARGGHQHSL